MTNDHYQGLPTSLADLSGLSVIRDSRKLCA